MIRTDHHLLVAVLALVLAAALPVVAVEDDAVVLPEATTDAVPVPDVVDVEADAVPALRIDLEEALGLAFTQGREKQTRDEDLVLVAHQLRVVRRDYGPRLTGSVEGSVFGDQGDAPDNTVGAELGVSHQLPTAGTLRAEASSRRTGRADDEDTTYDQEFGVSLTQPLLRGAGPLVWREDLTRAEREFLYARRGYQQFLQDLSLNIARDFWGLQLQQFRVESSRQDVARSEFVLAQARAFLDLGRTTPNDVFRADVALLQARQSLVDAIAAYDATLDRFKVELGLPVDAPIEIVGDAPRMPLIDIDPRQAIAFALDQRLDLRTVRDRIADGERALALARNRILPDLDLDARASWGDSTTRPWDRVLDRDPDYRIGLSLEIPFERHRERYSYAAALTALGQIQRDADLQESQVIRQVQASLRDLRIAEVSLQIQARNVEQGRKRLIKSQMDYEAGLISNRDLVEAQGEVRDAEVAYFRSQIDYREAELQLRRDTGVLTVGPAGAWRPDLPPYAEVRREEAEEENVDVGD